MASKVESDIAIEWKLSQEDRQQRRRDMEEVHLLTLNGEDFSKLPETRSPQYYDDFIDHKVCMYNRVKYKEIETLHDISHEGQLMTMNSIKSFHYHKV